MQRDYYGMPLAPYTPVQQRPNTLGQVLDNLRALYESEDPTAEELVRKGSGGFMHKPNPYYNQIQTLTQIVPELKKQFNKIFQPGAVYNTPLPPGQLYQNSAQGELDRMRGYRYLD